MRPVSPSTAFSVFVRLLAAATLIAVIAVGAPLHSHELVLGNDGGSSPIKAPCAACVTSSSPGLISERADVAPRFQPVGRVLTDGSRAVSLPLPIRSGRAPPAV